MSARRFVAYFFAIAAGSTFTFASTLRGQPASQGEAVQQVALQEAAVQEAMRETRTATNDGANALSSKTAWRSRHSLGGRHYVPAAEAPRATSVK